MYVWNNEESWLNIVFSVAATLSTNKHRFQQLSAGQLKMGKSGSL